MLSKNYKVIASAVTFGSLASVIGVTPADAAAKCIPSSEISDRISQAVSLDQHVGAARDASEMAAAKLRIAKAKELSARAQLSQALGGVGSVSLRTAKAVYAKARAARMGAQTRLLNARAQSEAVELAVRATVERQFSFYLCVDNHLLNLAASSGNGTVSVSWKVVEGASKYLVRRDGITVTTTTGTSFVDTNSSNGIEHTYEVFALAASVPDDEDEQTDPFEYSNHTVLTSDVVVAQGTLPAPASLSVSSTATSVTLMWSPVRNATAYQILRNGVVIASTMAANFIDTGLQSSSTFSYSVRAMQGSVLSIATPDKIASTLQSTLLAPTELRAVAGDSRVSLQWLASTNASGYKIYRDGLLLSTSASTSYVDLTAMLGVTYQYTVSATNSSGESSKSLAVEGAAVVTVPTGLSATPGDLFVDLQWSSVVGADSYRVYRNGSLIANVVNPSYIDTNVSNGTLYTYTVRTVIGTVASSPSVSAVAMPDSLVLTAPANIVAVPGDTKVTLTWDAVANASSYQVLRNGTVIGLPLSNSFVDAGLTNGVTYTYTLKAINGSHASLISSSVLATPSGASAGTLSAPTGVTATAGDSLVNLTWSAVAGATSYDVRRNGVLVATVSTSSYSDTGLSNGTTYSYTVTARNASSTSAASTTVSATPQMSAPGAPTGLVAVAGDATVSLSWNLVANATSYQILRNGTLVGTSATTSYVDSTALNGVTYSYTVKAVNAGGASAASAAALATPQAVVIAAPSGLVATAGDAQVALTWTAVTGASGYQVFRNGVLIANPVTNSYVDTGVTNGTTYSYTLKTVVGAATSAASTAVTATPVAAITQLSAPTGLAANTATALNTGAFRLQWNAVVGATGYEIYKDGVLLATSTTNSYTPPTVTFGAASTYYVRATDGIAAHVSLPSASITTGVYRGLAVNDALGRTVYGQIQVYAIVTGTAITGCWATYPTTSDSGPINRSAIPTLCSQTLTKQPMAATVATLITNVSGATATSPAFRTSLQDALTQAGR